LDAIKAERIPGDSAGKSTTLNGNLGDLGVDFAAARLSHL
jgi:hypothetical protein